MQFTGRQPRTLRALLFSHFNIRLARPSFCMFVESIYVIRSGAEWFDETRLVFCSSLATATSSLIISTDEHELPDSFRKGSQRTFVDSTRTDTST